MVFQVKTIAVKRKTGTPRGSYNDLNLRNEFNERKLIITAIRFVHYNHPLHRIASSRGQFSLKIEEQSLAPLVSEEEEEEEGK